MVTQRSSMVEGLTTVESKRSGLVSKVVFACGLTVATLGMGASAHASTHEQSQAQSQSNDAAVEQSVRGIAANPDKKEAKAAREKKKAERAARKEEKLAKAKSKKDDKVAKADKPMNDDMGGSDDPLEGL